MLLRISSERLGDTSVVRVDGSLSGEAIAEFEKTCRTAEGHLVIDLRSLLTADDVGVAVLRSLRDGGAELRDASPYVQLLIEEGKPSGRGHAR